MRAERSKADWPGIGHLETGSLVDSRHVAAHSACNWYMLSFYVYRLYKHGPRQHRTLCWYTVYDTGQIGYIVHRLSVPPGRSLGPPDRGSEVDIQNPCFLLSGHPSSLSLSDSISPCIKVCVEHWTPPCHKSASSGLISKSFWPSMNAYAASGVLRPKTFLLLLFMTTGLGVIWP